MGKRRFLRVQVRPQVLIGLLAGGFLLHGLSTAIPLSSAAAVVTNNDVISSSLPRVLSVVTELPTLPATTDCNANACVALTFDDGPEPTFTPRVLDILAKHRASATFFVQGYLAAKYPALIKQESQAGHSVQNHSWSHPDFRKLRYDQIRQQIDATQNAITIAGAPTPTLFRPPYGWRDRRVEISVDKPFILWNVDPQEWRPTDTREALIEAVVSHTKRGSIVLMHDTKPLTPDALDEIISKLQAANYQLVTVDELLKLPPGSKGEYFSQ